jgi:hypothetical protein
MWKIGRSVLIAVAALILSHNAAGGSIRTVARLFENTTSTPVIDAYGRTAFSLNQLRIEAPSESSLHSKDSVRAVPVLFNAGVYFERQLGFPERILTTSQQAPGFPTGVTYRQIENWMLGPEGDIAYNAPLYGPGIPGIYRATFAIDRNGISRLVFREGQQLTLPDTAGVKANFSFAPVYAAPSLADGRVTIAAGTMVLNPVTRILQEGTEGMAVLRNRVPIETFIRQIGGGNSIPTTIEVIATNIDQPNVSRDGSVVFRANLQAPAGHNTTFQSTSAIVATNPAGEFQSVAHVRENFVAGRIESFTRPVINGHGDVAFHATWGGTSNGRGIVRSTNGELEVAAQVGQLLPELGTGFAIASILEPSYLNERGDIAIGLTLSGPGVTSSNNSALFVDSPETGLTQIVRRGDRAPGTQPGVRFGAPLLTDLALNNAGQAAFYATLTGSGRSDDAGIWAYDRDGTLQLIARVGDKLDLTAQGGPSDLRTIAALYFAGGHGNSAALSTGFNDRGQIAFRARFTDHSNAIFVSNAVAIPEPATVAILLLGIAAAIGLRKPSHRT